MGGHFNHFVSWGLVIPKIMTLKNQPATEDEMVLAFLQAEARSPRFSSIQVDDLDPQLLFRPNLGSIGENLLRAQALAKSRGYGKTTFKGSYKGKYLFKNFPKDVIWERQELPLTKLKKVLYLNHPQWKTVSGGSRLLEDGAKNIHTTYLRRLNENVFDVLKALCRREILPEPILVVAGSKLVCLEGHTRLTAHVIRKDPTVTCFVGSSKSMRKWAKQKF